MIGASASSASTRIEDRRQLLVLDLDQARRFFRGFARLGRDGGDAVADKDAPSCRPRPAQSESMRPVPHVADVGRRSARPCTPGTALRRTRIDAHDVRVRVAG